MSALAAGRPAGSLSTTNLSTHQWALRRLQRRGQWEKQNGGRYVPTSASRQENKEDAKQSSGHRNKWTVWCRPVCPTCDFPPKDRFSAAELHGSIFHPHIPAGEQPVTTRESLIDVMECKSLTGIKLLWPQKLSCGPFGSEGCWLSSATPGLKMQFEDCFYLIVEVCRTSQREAKGRHIDVDVCAPCRTSLFTHLHSFWWQKWSLLAPKSLPLNHKKKMLGMIGLEHPSLAAHLHRAILSSAHSMLIKSSQAWLSLRKIRALSKLMPWMSSEQSL